MLVYTIRVATQLALGYLKPVAVSSLPGVKPFYEVFFFCGPTDMDSYTHMNNSNFLRIAELCRWRIFPKAWKLIVAENHATYSRQVKPFQRFVVRTSVSATDNKWLWYKHSFESVKPDAKTGEPLQYATIHCKAVLKEGSGKTIRASDYINMSDFNRQLVQIDESKVL